MPFNGTYGTGLTTSSNPDPNTLSTVSPYSSSTSNRIDGFSTAWKNQLKKLILIPDDMTTLENPPEYKIWFSAIPSNSAATYTLVLWKWCQTAGKWVQPVNASQTYTGYQEDFIWSPGEDALYLEVSSIDTGSLSVYIDTANAGVY